MSCMCICQGCLSGACQLCDLEHGVRHDEPIMAARCQECRERISTVFIRNPVTGQTDEYCAVCASNDTEPEDDE